MLLKDKVAIITGGGSGVGRAATQIFAANGAQVVCADINLEWAETSVSMVRDAGGTAVAQACDVRHLDEIEATIARALQEFGRLDIMYNNAGVATSSDGLPKTLLEQNDEDFERLVSINFHGALYGCQAAVRQFMKQGGGVIVNTSSVAGIVGWGGVMYGSTKGAVNQLTRSLAIEVAKEGIRVNAVCPAAMITNFGTLGDAGYREPSQEMIDRIGQLHPLGHPIAPEDTANAALFLASDLARNITGVLLPVDGGYSAA